MSKDIEQIIIYLIFTIYIYYFLKKEINIYTYILISLSLIIYTKYNNIIEKFDIPNHIEQTIPTPNHIEQTIPIPNHIEQLIKNHITIPISNNIEQTIRNHIEESNEIIFPFDLDIIKKTIYDLVNDDEIKKKIIYNLANENQYYNILVQLIKVDLEGIYKMYKTDYNKINDMIKNIYDKENKYKISSDSLSKKVNAHLKKNKKTYVDKNGFYKNKYTRNDEYDNDLKYSIYTELQHQSLGEEDLNENNGWDNDYIILNTDKWRPPIDHSFYRCKTESKCLVCPNMTAGYPVNLKDYNLSKKILPPDIINVDYIKDVLNSNIK